MHIFLISALKEWLSTVEKTKAKYHVMINPIIDNVDGKSNSPNITSSAQNIPFNFQQPRLTAIKLRPEWAMAADHPVFKVEYKDYIRNFLIIFLLL